LPALASSLRNFVLSTQFFTFFDWNTLRGWVPWVRSYGHLPSNQTWPFGDLGQFLGYVANQAYLPALSKYYAAEARAALTSAVVSRTSDPWNSNGLSIYLRADGLYDSRYESDATQFISATGWSLFVSMLNS
jgi:hypothetical protein